MNNAFRAIRSGTICCGRCNEIAGKVRFLVIKQFENVAFGNCVEQNSFAKLSGTTIWSRIEHFKLKAFCPSKSYASYTLRLKIGKLRGKHKRIPRKTGHDNQCTDCQFNLVKVWIRHI